LEAIVGFRFSVPLQNRAAKGRVAEARAEIDALGARGRFLRDQIAVEVEGVTIQLDAAERLAAIAEQERILAERLAEAERRRFALGSSDFFLVNQREDTANDARVALSTPRLGSPQHAANWRRSRLIAPRWDWKAGIERSAENRGALPSAQSGVQMIFLLKITCSNWLPNS
jgi:outer membrane protein TolC